MPRTIPELVNTASADAPALLAPGRPLLDCAGLYEPSGPACGAGGRTGFAGERLAPCKVREQVVFLKEILRGAKGMLQRIGLVGKTGQ